MKINSISQILQKQKPPAVAGGFWDEQATD